MFTNNEFISKFGRSFNHTTDFIDVISGDCNKIPVHVEGTQLDPIEKMCGLFSIVFGIAQSD